MTNKEIVALFKAYGLAASFHYADDSGHEWAAGRQAQDDAENLFDHHPELEQQFREEAKGFLWSLALSRPPKQKY